MNIQEQFKANEDQLKLNPYPGRGIIIGILHLVLILFKYIGLWEEVRIVVIVYFRKKKIIL
ncbi:hypothetical protein [Paenibacillus psychroresistens]|uniref:hypothetical protein n=1 Tax=Paenibacillus psychroresistens TaxID=1778678 RepID=UPI001D048443|nr:hypothetical protein [Paenibacillus psychroresistens]